MSAIEFLRGLVRDGRLDEIPKIPNVGITRVSKYGIVVRVANDEELMSYIDLFWLAKQQLDREAKLDILSWVEQRFKASVKDLKLNPELGTVDFISENFVYRLRPDGTITQEIVDGIYSYTGELSKYRLARYIFEELWDNIRLFGFILYDRMPVMLSYHDGVVSASFYMRHELARDEKPIEVDIKYDLKTGETKLTLKALSKYIEKVVNTMDRARSVSLGRRSIIRYTGDRSQVLKLLNRLAKAIREEKEKVEEEKRGVVTY